MWVWVWVWVWVVWERGIEISEESATSIFKVVSEGSMLLQNKYFYQNIRQNRSLHWQLLFSHYNEIKPDAEEFASASRFQRIHSPDFMKFGLEAFMHVSFERFLYLNCLYKFCSSMLIIKPVKYVNSTVQGHTSTYTAQCFVLGSLGLSRTKETQLYEVYCVRRVSSETSSHIAQDKREKLHVRHIDLYQVLITHMLIN